MGLTIPEVDKLLAYYLEKSHKLHLKELIDHEEKYHEKVEIDSELYQKLSKDALDLSIKEMEDGIQGIEYKCNTVASARGDFPFISWSFGVFTDNIYGPLVTSAILKVRRMGQGEKGKKKCVLFPKLNFLYDENKHGEGKEFEYLFDEAIECSSKAMYPNNNWDLV